MNVTKNTLLIIVLAVVVMISLYCGSETIMDGGMNEGLHENSRISGNVWYWFPTIVTLAVGVLIGWLLFRMKK